MSLRVRLALSFGAAAALASIAVALFAYASTEHRLHGDLDRAVVTQAQTAAALLDRPGAGPPGSIRRFGPGGRVAEPVGPRQVLDVTGAAVDAGGSVALPIDATDRAMAAARVARTRVREAEIDGSPVRLATVAVRRGGAVQVATSAVSTESSLGALALRFELIGLLVTVAAAMAGVVVATRLARPIERLAAEADRVAATGDLAAPVVVPVGGGSEVARLAASYSAMFAALASSRADQRRLVQDAGHELRTPLTSIRTNLDVLARHGDIDPAMRSEVLADLSSEVGELSRLVDEIVQLAAGDLVAQPPPEPLDLADVVAGAVDRAQRRTGRRIDTQLEPTPVRGVTVDLERAVANLLDNADKFSPPGAPIEVGLQGRVLSVSDHGPGIAEAERALVFERFHRSPDARAVPGSGLGLAIVAQVAAGHGGQAWAAARPDQTPGATVYLSISPTA